MSSDKRKKFQRACALLLEINTSLYYAARLSGTKSWGKKRIPNRFSTRSPTVRYIVARGMGRIIRVRRGRSYAGITVLDTGFWPAPGEPGARL